MLRITVLVGTVAIAVLSGCSTDLSMNEKEFSESQMDAASTRPPQGARLSPHDAVLLAACRLERDGQGPLALTAPTVSYLGPQRSLRSLPHKLWLVIFSTDAGASSDHSVGVYVDDKTGKTEVFGGK